MSKCCTPEGQIKRYVDCIGCDRKLDDMKKLTAVEWLFAHLLPHLDWSNVEDRIRFRQLKQEALNIEKEQSIEFCQKKECNILNIINPLTQKQQECKVYIDSFYKKYKKLPSVSNVAEALSIKRTAAYHRMKKVKEYNSIYGGKK